MTPSSWIPAVDSPNAAIKKHPGGMRFRGPFAKRPSPVP